LVVEKHPNGAGMSTVSRSTSGPGAAANVVSFWVAPRGRDLHTTSTVSRRAFSDLVARVIRSPGIVLFDAVEEGVPTYLVNVIAVATRQPVSVVMDIIGVSPTTFRRKEEANEPLPDVAGHRVMGFLRIAATLRRLLDESGDPEALQTFDLEGWLADWMQQQLPELGGKTPAEMLRNPEGLRAVEQVLERMRGGLAA
jgi:putative toxin-antitoxin system antitoxin component (TIGR02293 family)